MNQPLPLRPTFEAAQHLMPQGPDGPGRVLQAILCPTQSGHPQAAQSLCEALALGFLQPLSDVLSAGDWANSSALPFCDDDLGIGRKAFHSQVLVAESLPRHEHRLKGFGAFCPLRQLSVRGAP